MSDLTPDHLVEMQIADIRLAAAKMSGPQRRNFIAEMSLKYCYGNPRLTENTLDTLIETGFAKENLPSSRSIPRAEL